MYSDSEIRHLEHKDRIMQSHRSYLECAARIAEICAAAGGSTKLPKKIKKTARIVDECM